MVIKDVIEFIKDVARFVIFTLCACLTNIKDSLLEMSDNLSVGPPFHFREILHPNNIMTYFSNLIFRIVWYFGAMPYNYCYWIIQKLLPIWKSIRNKSDNKTK
ncbi:uncharacterized protein LOC129608360 [Condylostylus longicornis]|uniref:uncharacterized protein LOC129608360 n=1 Tax=Condylostylus longicornis TaxID=2530218 RepID=UPI00244DE47D|nr:uncharacterized protein LOC129608360 [Condylostylus longicornis]